MGTPNWGSQFGFPIAIYVIVGLLVSLLDLGASSSHSSPHSSDGTSSISDSPQSERVKASKAEPLAVANNEDPDSVNQQNLMEQKSPIPEASINETTSSSNEEITDLSQNRAVTEGNSPNERYPGNFNSTTEPQDPDTRQYTSLIERAIAATNNNDDLTMNDCLTQISRSSKPQPGDTTEATRLNKLGLKELKNKRFSEAASYFGAAAQTDPSNPKYLSNLGYAEIYAGDLDSAQKHLYTAISIAPARAVAWGDLGLAFAKTGEQERAASCLLIGYKVSEGKTLSFLESLKQDDDSDFRTAGETALSRLKTVSHP